MLKLTHTRAVFLMVVVTLLWSIAGLVTRHLEQARSFEVTFWRSFFTLLSLLVMLPAIQGRGVFGTIRRGGAALWLSGLCWATMFTAFMVALTLMPVANVLVTMAVGPLLTALFARIFIGHRMEQRVRAELPPGTPLSSRYEAHSGITAFALAASGAGPTEKVEAVSAEPRPLVDLERDAIAAALRYFTGNRTRAAEALGIGVRTLYDKIKRYDLEDEPGH